MNKNHTATIEIDLGSKELTETIWRALTPESDTRAKIRTENSTLTIRFETKTLATLRALTNSYLRGVIAAKNSVDAARASSI